MTFFGGAPGVSYSPDWWAKVYALFETSFPGLPAGVERAGAVGVPWPSVTTPFVGFDGDEAVSHVGVLMQPMRLNGEDRLVAGIHAVCTRPSHRGRGLARRLLAGGLRLRRPAHPAQRAEHGRPADLHRPWLPRHPDVPLRRQPRRAGPGHRPPAAPGERRGRSSPPPRVAQPPRPGLVPLGHPRARLAGAHRRRALPTPGHGVCAPARA
ncbi:MAG: GNAT family N-acetyltransferase [Deltaproteobacteria bacterium]|nr:GNAT family N-acetyltransferase [Deltaproteobacteria bacterium]